MTFVNPGTMYHSIDHALTGEGATFTVTDQHVALLRCAVVGWDDCEFGAPAIDSKRPYGSSGVVSRIAEILAEPEWTAAVEQDSRDGDEDAQDSYLSRHHDRLVRLHAETGIVLQIALATGRFEPGLYRKGKAYHSSSWAKVDTP